MRDLPSLDEQPIPVLNPSPEPQITVVGALRECAATGNMQIETAARAEPNSKQVDAAPSFQIEEMRALMVEVESLAARIDGVLGKEWRSRTSLEKLRWSEGEDSPLRYGL